MLACGELGILSVDAPTPFICEKYQHDFATVYLPYHRHSAWSDGDQLLIGRHQESILYLAPGADIGVESEASSGVLVLIPRALLVQRVVVMSRGGVFSSVIQARLQRSHVFDASTPRDRELNVGLYGCLFALDGVLKSGAGNVSLVSLDDVFLRILMLLLFPELQVIDESQSVYKPELVRMKELEDWIMANLGAKISLSQLETLCGYSSRTLHDYFVAQHALSPKQWIIKQRLKKALQMLAAGDERPMAEIAAECGYPDSSRFAKHFSKEFGFLPRHCRSAEADGRIEAH